LNLSFICGEFAPDASNRPITKLQPCFFGMMESSGGTAQKSSWVRLKPSGMEHLPAKASVPNGPGTLALAGSRPTLSIAPNLPPPLASPAQSL